MSDHEHFDNKSPLEHIIEARKKGRSVSAEVHGIEMPGHMAAFSDSLKEVSFLFLLLITLFPLLSISETKTFAFLALFCASLLIWKCGRSQLLGAARMERLKRLSQEEISEIEHHPEQETLELRALYEAKGLSGKLLDQVVTVLMADKNRALMVMLEEEMAIPLEAYEHPLKQASGALFGILLGSAILLATTYFFSYTPAAFASGILVVVASYISVRIEGNRAIEACVWNLALLGLSTGAIFFLSEIFLP